MTERTEEGRDRTRVIDSPEPTTVLDPLFTAEGPPLAPRPETIGRYRVLGELGRGGMGVVYEAYDPSLDRTIAIKLVHPSRSSPDARARLAREARVLAQLSHPHVVEVFEIGDEDDCLFIAMELVRGRDLRQWRDAAKRSLGEMLAKFIDAAAGLAAAHAVGLVHRDFKPDNVMVGAEGRVRVLDFGLARPAAAISSAGSDTALKLSPDDRLTQTGLAMGTPAYMAPEQFRNAVDDPRTDQFAFGVSLFEMLTGRRPFHASSYKALAKVIARADLGEFSDHGIPRPVFRVLTRMLAAEPDDRYPDMRAVIDALEAVRRPSRARWLWPGALGMGLVTTAVLVLSSRGSTSAESECMPSEQHREALWGDDRKAAVRDAILHTGVRYAEPTWERVDNEIESYASAWAAERYEVCRTIVDDRRDANADERVACLEHRRVALTAALGVLARADDATVHNAEQTVRHLPTVKGCTTSPWGGEGEATSAAHEAAQRRIASAEAHYHMGRYAAGLAELDAAATEMGEEPPARLVAAMEFIRGLLEEAQGRALPGAQALERAYFAALESEQLDLACRAASRVAAEPAVPYRERWQWAGHAKAALERHGPDEALASAHDRAMCALYRDSGDLERAVERCEQTLAAAERHDPPDPAAMAQALADLGAVVAVAEDSARAYALRQRALELAERAWGPGHPRVADAANDLGFAALARGQNEEAEALAARALAIRREVLGAEHPDTVLAEDLKVRLLRAQRRDTEAKALAQRGLDLRLRVHGETHPLVARSVFALALAQERLGEHESALRSMQRVAEIEEHLHPLNIDRIPTLREQARMAFEIGGGPLEGRIHLERAWAIVRDSEIPDDHPLVRDLHHGYGETLLELGEVELSLPHLERFVADPRPHPVLTHVQFVLARALVAAGRDHERAFGLVRAGIETWENSETEFHAAQVASMRTWLAEHDPR